MNRSDSCMTPPSNRKSSHQGAERSESQLQPGESSPLEAKCAALKDFSSLAFTEVLNPESKALALASYLSAQRFQEGSDCTDHVHWDATRPLTDTDIAKREEVISIVTQAAGVPLSFQFNTAETSQSLYEGVLTKSEPLLALARLTESAKQLKVREVPKPSPVQSNNEGGPTCSSQVIDFMGSPEHQDRPFRKRRHLHHTTIVKQKDAPPSPKKIPSRSIKMVPKISADEMDVDKPGENEPSSPVPEKQDHLRTLGFQTAGDRMRANGYKNASKGKGNGLGSQGAGGGRAPRIGLTRPATDNADHLRGGFVPPFVKKGIEDSGEQDQKSSFSPKTLELLAGPDGELPEQLQKLDPNLIETICSEVIEHGGKVEWDDIAGQGAAKQLVQELVVWPMLNPHLFKGARTPPRGLLLFGPPGTGKTLIGRAIASNIRATFFSISASSLTSKWIGEGEKLVRTLFAISECIQPAVIFIDEIDSILSARKAEGEHEASRRLKTELLVQMEGCNTKSEANRVLLIGATNRPEELDEAARRRMPKQLYIPLPCSAARAQIIQRQLMGIRSSLSSSEINKVVEKTAGYSGSDMKNLVQEACQGPVRDAIQGAHRGRSGGFEVQPGISELSDSDLRPVVIKDFQVAARAQKPSVGPEEVARHEAYDVKHGAKYVEEIDDASSEEW